jgi:nicotinamidase/pyrazinamidase
MEKSALIIVDVQRDFCPGGALPAALGFRVVEVINALMDHFPLIVASKDWHPAETVHFHQWPPHCIRGSEGARFAPGLRQTAIDVVALKGTGNSDDGYSAFEATNIDLAHVLRKQGVTRLCVTGLTTEYCVKSTALDALHAGFEVWVVTDAVAPVEALPGDGEAALRSLADAGIGLTDSRHLPQ